MICTRCGAPIPTGMTDCPCCGTKAASPAKNQFFEEETIFDGDNADEFCMDSDEKTEFADGGWAVQDAMAEETEFAQSPESRPTLAMTFPAPKKRPERKQGRKAQKTRKEKKNTKLQAMLLIVLATLIAYLLLR